VTIEDLMDMLRGEFALDVPQAQNTLNAWRAAPDAVPEDLPEMLSLLDRSAEVVQVVGLHGLARFLQHVAQFARRVSDPNTVFSPPGAATFTQLASIAWLSAWVDKTSDYLARPAQPATVDLLAKYLYRCPAKLPTDALLELAEQLAIPPQLPSNDPENEPLDLAVDADVLLSTEEVDSDLLQALLQDAPVQLEQLESTLQRWANGQVDERQMLEAQRIAHTFKGSGNIIGLPGIGRMAHRLEDVLEYALGTVQNRQSANPAIARDSLRAVLSLQQMVAFLQGEDAEPADVKPVLQRLLDWVELIRSGQADSASLEPLAGSAQLMNPVVEPQGLTDSGVLRESQISVVSTAPFEPLHATTASASAAAPQATAVAAPEGTTLRIGVDRLSRMLRRAGQSIVQAQRLAQLLTSSNDRLEATVRSQQRLHERLRELEALVGGQATVLREQQNEGDFDPLELDRYDALHVLTRTIAESAQDSRTLVEQAQLENASASAVIRDEGYALTDQHRELLAARLVPAKTMLPRLKRNVAQTASTTGKQVVLSIVGESVLMDADVLTRLTEPLLHLLRNAVDHGIELPAERVASGKREHGVVSVSFRAVGQEIEIVVADDGRGLDLPAIVEKAQAFGLLAPGAKLSGAELRRLILQPGFSTRSQVTEVSGRGVGMDVVNDRVSALKGRIDIQSQAMQGSTFTLHVPVTSGVTHALIVQCAQESIGLSADQVVTVLPAGVAQIQRDGKMLYIMHDGILLPAFVLSNWLGFEEDSDELGPSELARKVPVLVNGADQITALLVDAVLDSRELILQGIGQLARRIRGVVGGALRTDGKPLFLIDAAELERATRTSTQLVSSAALRRRLRVDRTRVLVVDDALSVRRAMQQLLADAGYDVAMAADGFEAIEQIRLKRPALMLTDLEMPNLNGLELTRRLREVPQWMDIPVIMITSRAGDKHRNMAAQAGVDMYLTKPYLDGDLLEHVRTLCAASNDALVF
jgi:chemotaxis protein histidine kinase CheA/ActR/RegA family two-component response regulator